VAVWEGGERAQVQSQQAPSGLPGSASNLCRERYYRVLDGVAMENPTGQYVKGAWRGEGSGRLGQLAEGLGQGQGQGPRQGQGLAILTLAQS
jgi:hypothetical protein